MKEYWRKKKYKVLTDGGEIREIYFPTPVDKNTEESFKKWKKNKDYQMDRKEIRNPKFHMKYMKLIRFCFQHLPEKYAIHFKDFDQTRAWIEWEARNVEYYLSPPILKSTFDKRKFIEMLGDGKYSKETIIGLMAKATINKKEPEIRMKPKSVAFDKMEEQEFEELYQRIMDTVTLILDVNDKVIRDELKTYE